MGNCIEAKQHFPTNRLAAMTSILANAGRRLKHPLLPLRTFLPASASIASSSHCYASKPKKPTNAPAIEVPHTGEAGTLPSAQTKAIRDLVGLTEDAAAILAGE